MDMLERKWKTKKVNPTLGDWNMPVSLEPDDAEYLELAWNQQDQEIYVNVAFCPARKGHVCRQERRDGRKMCDTAWCGKSQS